MRSLRSVSLVALVLAGMVSIASAGSPRLARISPAGAQSGTTVDVDFSGRYLDEPREVLLYEKGITIESVKVVTSAPGNKGKDQPVEKGTVVRVRMKIAADCPAGPHGMRLLTAEGLTEYRRFFVSPFPIIQDEEQNGGGPTAKRNNTRETAMAVPANSTIHARMNEPSDLDIYKIDVKKGQRVSAEVEAARIGVDRGLPDLYLTIYDPNGKKLGSVDDSALYLQDPILSVAVEQDGPHYVEVRHNMYNAAGDNYRLHIGTFARPTGIYPSGGPVGDTIKVQILGDPLGGWTQSVTMPKEAGDVPFLAVDPKTGVPACSPNTLRASPFPNVLEQEPNDTPESVSGTPATLPVAFNGIIQKPGDIDCFRFTAKKGEAFKIHALAMALGSPLDPVIWVKPIGKGSTQRVAESRPSEVGLPPTGGLNKITHDPVLEFTAAADGEYVLGIEDERGEGGSDYVYRIEVRPEDNAVFTYIAPEPENQFQPQLRQNISVPVGNRYTAQFGILSTNRPFSGELEVFGVNLPKGVTVHAPKVTPGMARVPVVFEVAPGTRPQSALVDIAVRPVGGSDKSLVSGYRQTILGNQYGNNDYYQHVPVTKLALAVIEPVRFAVEVEQPKSSLVQNGEMVLNFKVKRAPGFEGPVTVQMEWKPNGVNTATPVTIPADKSEGTYLLGAARNASPGNYQMALTAMSGGARQGYGDSSNRTYVASQPFKVTIAEPHVEAKLARTSIERGKTATIVCKLNHLQKFDGKAQATLSRLPRGVVLKEPMKEISSEDKEVSFTLEATNEALLGNYKGVVFDVIVMENGQAVRQLSGDGQLRIDAERGAAARK